jgi:hypothetical protein
LILAESGLAAGGTAAAQGELLLSGRVRLVGSALFPRLALTDEEGRDWFVEGADRRLLAPYEQCRVKVRGRPEYREIILAKGQRAGTERFLRALRLEEVFGARPGEPPPAQSKSKF